MEEEVYIGGQRVVIDVSDNPSDAEKHKRYEEAYLAAMNGGTPAQTQQTQPQQTQPQQSQQPTDTDIPSEVDTLPSHDEMGRVISYTADQLGITDTLGLENDAPVATEEEGYSVGEHIGEIPSAVAEGTTKALFNTSNLLARGLDKATFGYYGDFSKWANDALGLGYVHFTDDGVRWAGEDDTPPEDYTEVLNVRTGTGDFVSATSQFITGFALTRGAGNTAGLGNSVAQNAGYAVVGEQIAFDPHEARLSNLVQEYPSLENPITEYLAADENDSEAEARLKMAIEALGLEGTGFVLFNAISKMGKGLRGINETPSEDEILRRWADEQVADLDVSISELDAKLEKAVKAETELRETYAAADAAADVLSGETIAGIKQQARNDAVAKTKGGVGTDDGIPDPLDKRLAEDYGYGVIKTQEQLMRQADEVIAEAFIDSPTIQDTLKNAKEIIGDPAKFDQWMASTGRLVQLTNRNMIKARSAISLEEKALSERIAKITKDTNLHPSERAHLLKEAHDGFSVHMNRYRQVRNDYIESVAAFRGAATTAGRAVNVNKLFQGFDVPAHEVEAHFDKILKSLPSEKQRNSFVFNALGTMWNKSLDVTRALDEMFIAGILTGPKTHMINMATNSATLVYLPAERGLSAIFQAGGGDFKGARKTLRSVKAQYAAMRHQLWESATLAAQAYRDSDNILDHNTTYDVTSSKHVIGRDLQLNKEDMTQLVKYLTFQESENITMADVFGTTMRLLSTRGLAAEDEFFKNMNFRSRVFGDAFADGLEEASGLGLKGKEANAHAAAYANNSLSRALTEQMMLGKHKLNTNIGIEPYRASGLQYAREATFTQDLGPKSQLFLRTVDKIPLARQIFPFVRTPLNLQSAAIQRSPLAPLSGRWWDDMNAGGERRALAMTRFSIGGMILASWMTDFGEKGITFQPNLQPEEGDVQIRGAGPSSIGQRRNQQQLSNHIFGSIVMPDGTQYQISRADPFSTIFEGIGIIQDLHRNGKVEEADNAALSYALAITRMMADETYATSIRQLMTAMQTEEGFSKFARNRIVQMGLMSGAVKTYNNHTDPFQRELRSMNDVWKAMLPSGTDGWDNALGEFDPIAPKYNLLGEKVEQVEYATLGLLPESAEELLSPVMTGKVAQDPTGAAIAALGISSGLTPPVIAGGSVDLRKEVFSKDAYGEPLYENGLTAYDRLNEILSEEKLLDGMTLRERLDSVINSKDYKNYLTDNIRVYTPDGKKKSLLYSGSRKDVILSILADGKKAAQIMLEEENPRVRKAVFDHEERKDQAFERTGQKKIHEYNNELNSVLTGE